MVTGLLQMLLPQALLLLLLLVEECGLDGIRRRRSHDPLRPLRGLLWHECAHCRRILDRGSRLLLLLLLLLEKGLLLLLCLAHDGAVGAAAAGDRSRALHLVLIGMVVMAVQDVQAWSLLRLWW
uniref:Secreted protein n=1 Tax=Anopheles darlingi TaxID=43151 RepID=A0A2M4CXB3_ANODA